MSTSEPRPDPLHGTRLAWTVAIAAVCAFALLASFSMLRPVREEMGVRGGLKNLPWLFSGTFVAMLLATPLFGLVSSLVSRRSLLVGTYAFFAANLLGFWLLMRAEVAPAWIAKAFFIWVSVFNLFVVSVFWSLMADVFSSRQAKGLYGYIAAGASVGAVAGPGFTALASGWIGTEQLLLVAAGALCVPIGGVLWICHGVPAGAAQERPIGGGVLDGVRRAFSSRLLLGLCGYFVLFTMVATFLYLEQLRIAEAAFTVSEDRVRFFATIDVVTNVVTIALQVIVTRLVLLKAGSLRTLLILPCVTLLGLIALTPGTSAVLLGAVQVIRRATDYAFARPARESLFTLVPREDRFKSKNFIDTVVYRGGDMMAAWVDAGLKALHAGAATLAVIGIPLVLIWITLILWLGRVARPLEAAGGAPADDPPRR